MVNAPAPSFAGATQWLNSRPLAADDLRGSVVLVEFWTYTCVNWLRTLPYVRAWAQKYKSSGLVVIGVHTPEFSFEKNLDNVRRATKEMQIEYPVAVDSDYAVWNAFGNEYWPAMYLIDAQGRMRYHQFGEGEYDRTERVVQELLGEAGKRDIGRGLVSVDPKGLEVGADWNDVRSAENFLGYERTAGFASPGGAVPDTLRSYAFPTRFGLNDWALAGRWTVDSDRVASVESGAKIAYRFHARDVNLIMGPKPPAAAIRFRVLVDGKPPAASRGDDVDAAGAGTIAEQRTYQLIRQPKPIVDRQFEIEFLDPGVEAFDFTFG